MQVGYVKIETVLNSLSMVSGPASDKDGLSKDRGTRNDADDFGDLW